MREIKKAYNVFLESMKGTDSFEDIDRREDDIKVDIREIGFELVD